MIFNEYERLSPRPMTFAERKINFLKIQRNLDKFERIFNKEFKLIKDKTLDDIINNIKIAINRKDIKKIKELKVKFKWETVRLMSELNKKLYEQGKTWASTEMWVPIPWNKAEVINSLKIQVSSIVDKIYNDIQNDAKTITTEIINSKWWISKTSNTEVIPVVRDILGKSIDKKAQWAWTLVLQGGLNLGRTTVFETYPEKVYAMQYSAILDSRTTPLCLSLDWRIVKPWSSEFYMYAPPNHYNCRSIWVEILMDEEFKPRITWIPKSIPVNRSISQNNMMKTPKVLKDSLAIDIIKQEIKNRQEKLDKLVKEWKYKNRQEQHKKRIKELEKSIKWFKEILDNNLK